MHPKDRLGRDGEDAAVQHLRTLGMKILDRNWRCRYGELDVVASERGTLVFVEVKTRSTTRFGHPLESITRKKLARLRRLAGLWMIEHGMRAALRLDAIAVHASSGGAMRVEHVRGIS